MDIQKLYNFKKYIEDNLLKYVDESLIENAELNLGLIESLPTFMVLRGLKNTLSEKTNEEIIAVFCSDYFIEIEQLTNEEINKINRYINYFKLHLL